MLSTGELTEGGAMLSTIGMLALISLAMNGNFYIDTHGTMRRSIVRGFENIDQAHRLNDGRGRTEEAAPLVSRLLAFPNRDLRRPIRAFRLFEVSLRYCGIGLGRPAGGVDMCGFLLGPGATDVDANRSVLIPLGGNGERRYLCNTMKPF